MYTRMYVYMIVRTVRAYVDGQSTSGRRLITGGDPCRTYSFGERVHASQLDTTCCYNAQHTSMKPATSQCQKIKNNNDNVSDNDNNNGYNSL